MRLIFVCSVFGFWGCRFSAWNQSTSNLGSGRLQISSLGSWISLLLIASHPRKSAGDAQVLTTCEPWWTTFPNISKYQERRKAFSIRQANSSTAICIWAFEHQISVQVGRFGRIWCWTSGNCRALGSKKRRHCRDSVDITQQHSRYPWFACNYPWIPYNLYVACLFPI